VPDAVSPLTAAAALLQGLTAVTLLTESYNVQRDDTVLVHTVAGGMGLLLTQIAKTRGATVIGTTSTEAKAKLAREHGADHVILYPTENTVQRVLELTGGAGVDVIYDGVGKDTFESDFEMIRRTGTLVSYGSMSGAVPPVPLSKLTPKNVKLLRPYLSHYTVTLEERDRWGAELWKVLLGGQVKINIFQEYPFTAEGVQQAHRDLTQAGGKTTGKLVIKVAEK